MVLDKEHSMKYNNHALNILDTSISNTKVTGLDFNEQDYNRKRLGVDTCALL